MRVFLVGVTGRTGKWILNAALTHGHKVTALVRPPLSRIGVSHPSLTLVSGDLLTVENLESALTGYDVIISALNSQAVEFGTQKLISAAKLAGVARFMGIAGGGILQLDEERLRRDRPGYPEVFRQSSARHLKAWKALAASGMDWTLICTPDILDAPGTGQAIFREDYMPVGGNSVTAGDVAELIIGELATRQFLKKRVGFVAKVREKK